jgi:hypothetical protein
MMRHVHGRRTSMLLAFRGAAKTTYCTTTRTVGLLLRNPDARVVIASRVSGNAEKMLSEIRAHFEKNERLRELFGDWVGDKWGERAITVNRRTRWTKEPSVTALGIDSGVASQHYDLGIADDIMDEENSQTAIQREEAYAWYYRAYLPTIDPKGCQQVHGTRWHPLDIYGHLLEHEMKDATLTIPILDREERSTWEEQHPTADVLERKRTTPVIYFQSQWMCDASAMKGTGIIHVDWCLPAKPADVPPTARRYMGVDLAISQKQTADKFAINLLAVSEIPGAPAERANVWNLACFDDRLTFAAQKRKIVDWVDAYGPVACGIEANAYQMAMIQELLREYPHLKRVVIPVFTLKDARARVVRLSAEFENGQWHFLPGQESLIDQLVMFEGKESVTKLQRDDKVDALVIARQVSMHRERKKPRRAVEPGLL